MRKGRKNNQLYFTKLKLHILILFLVNFLFLFIVIQKNKQFFLLINIFSIKWQIQSPYHVLYKGNWTLQTQNKHKVKIEILVFCRKKQTVSLKNIN